MKFSTFTLFSLLFILGGCTHPAPDGSKRPAQANANQSTAGAVANPCMAKLIPITYEPIPGGKQQGKMAPLVPKSDGQTVKPGRYWGLTHHKTGQLYLLPLEELDCRYSYGNEGISLGDNVIVDRRGVRYTGMLELLEYAEDPSGSGQWEWKPFSCDKALIQVRYNLVATVGPASSSPSPPHDSRIQPMVVRTFEGNKPVPYGPYYATLAGVDQKASLLPYKSGYCRTLYRLREIGLSYQIVVDRRGTWIAKGMDLSAFVEEPPGSGQWEYRP